MVLGLLDLKFDSFGVTFPKNVDVKHKALFLAATFLVDKKHFSNPTLRKDYSCSDSLE